METLLAIVFVLIVGVAIFWRWMQHRLYGPPPGSARKVITTKIVGVTRRNVDGSKRQEIIEECRVIQPQHIDVTMCYSIIGIGDT